MAAIDRIRNRFEHIGTSITEGWRRLTDATGQAITRFTPSHRESAEQDRDLDRRNIGGGLLPVEVFDQNARIEVRLEAPELERDDNEVAVVGDDPRIAGEKRVKREHREGRLPRGRMHLWPFPATCAPAHAGQARLDQGHLSKWRTQRDVRKRRGISTQAHRGAERLSLQEQRPGRFARLRLERLVRQPALAGHHRG